MCITFVFSLTDAEKRQETPPPIRKRKSNDERSSSEENKRPKSSVTYPTLKLKEPYQIGTTSWIRKKINTYALERLLVSSAFGLLEYLLSFLLFYYFDALLHCLFYRTIISVTNSSHVNMGFRLFMAQLVLCILSLSELTVFFTGYIITSSPSFYLYPSSISSQPRIWFISISN